MKAVQDHIERKQQDFGKHAFFQRLSRTTVLGEILPFPSMLTFWVLTFQDVLQINARKICDPDLARMARSHMAEDAGHDRWFLNDLLAIDGAHPDVSRLFGKDHRTVRHVSYDLMAEVYREQSDIERIVMLEALESSSHIFFEKIVAFFEAHGVQNALKYFGRQHLDAENSHEMFDMEMEATIAQTILGSGERNACIQLVDRCYQAFHTIFDELESTLAEQAGALSCEAIQARETHLKSRERAYANAA
ncbi:MAG TPA: hypothetical protein VIT92_09420 [Burkholderiaceae bacterium]